MQGQRALGSGGLFGVGLGASVGKIGYVPEAQSDFILAVIGQELGLAGVFALISLYGMIAFAGLRSARRAGTRYAKLLATGLTSLILCQGLLNIFVVLGIAPLTGVPLPFISYAPTNLCVMLASVGVLLGMARPRARSLRAVDGSVADASDRPADRDRGRGDGGHVVPALAVADALRAEGAEVQFVGGDRAEAELVPAAGYRLHRLRMVALPRGANPAPLVRAVAIDAAALSAARSVVRLERPSAVLGAGGYVAGPVSLAAVLQRVPLVLAEADSHLGLTNRLLAPAARRVCLAFPIAGRTGRRYLVTGRPAPPAAGREAARRRFAIPPGETCVLVFGGSLGARSINLAAIDAFRGTSFHVLHAAGERDLPTSTPRARTMNCAATSPTSARRWPPPTSSLPAPAARCSRSPRPAGPPCSSPIRTPPPTTRPPTPGTWPTPARR